MYNNSLFKRAIALTGFTLLFLLFNYNLTFAQDLEWVKQIGGGNYEMSSAITTDALGNIYSTGYFEQTVDFDPGPGVHNLNAGQYESIYIQKLDKDGNFIWVKKIGGVKQLCTSITVDLEGNVYTTGFFTSTVDFDPSFTDVFQLTSQGYYDTFIQKLDKDGNFLWAKSIGALYNQSTRSLAIDRAGNVYTIGYFQGIIDIDPSSGVHNLTVQGVSDTYIQKLNSNGDFVWGKSIGGTEQTKGYSIAVDLGGNVYNTGAFSGTSDFDPNSGVYNLTAQGSGKTDAYIQKLDTDGNFLWAKSMGGNNSETGYSITVDLSGDVYSTGSFAGTSDFDPSSGVYNLTAQGTISDVYIQKLDKSGNFIWAKDLGGNSSIYVSSIDTDLAGNVYTSGYFNGTIDFDPNSGVYDLRTKGNTDGYIHKLDKNGDFVWATTTGATAFDRSISIVIDATGNVYNTGYFSRTVDFDPSSGVYNLTSNGGYDIYIQKYSSIISSVVTPNKTTILKAYPNPSRDNIQIDLEQFYKNVTVKVHDALGQVINTYQYNNTKSIRLNLNEEKGLYFLDLSADAEKIGTVKVLKQ